MIISPEQQKANNARYWLAFQLRDFDPARFAEDKNLRPITEDEQKFLTDAEKVRPTPGFLGSV